MACDFCGSSDYEEVYKPIGSRKDASVCVCNSCGLVFSIFSNNTSNHVPTASGDADWGNVRFAKGQRLEAIKDWLPTKANKVLDIGSNRGDFVNWMLENNPKANIIAIEPDGTLVSSYENRVQLYQGKFEDFGPLPNTYDFVYCCQTLEHARSASEMLKKIYDCLKPKGQAFIEVPNIEVIRYPQNVEEFFIDKHNFHFNKWVLCGKLAEIGFQPLRINHDDLNVASLVIKDGKSETWEPKIFTRDLMVEANHAFISLYEKNIKYNRAKLPCVTEKISRIRGRVAFWGANTILDLLVRYGNFNPKSVGCLVDTYMFNKLDAVHGVPIQSPETLRIYQPDTCIVLARFSADAIVEKAKSFGIRNVIKFSDLLEAV